MNFDPRIDVKDPELLGLLVKIESYRLSISQIPVPPKVSEKINSLNIIRQIRGTTGIEGNTLEEEDIGRLLKATSGAADGKGKNNEEQEVINAKEVFDFIREDVKNNPEATITQQLIKKLHYLTTKDCNYPENLPGYYRVGGVTAGQYYPPEHHQIELLMQRFLELINNRQIRQAYTPVIRSILAHFYLVSIHPFRDGNGRTSRALEAYVLYHSGYNIRGFYSLANFYYKNRAEYIDRLQDARFKYNGDLNDFIKFSLDGYLFELEFIQSELITFVKLLTFKDYVNELALIKTINKRQHQLLDFLLNLDLGKAGKIIELPSIPVVEYKKKTNPMVNALYETVTTKTFLRDFKGLLEQDLILIKNDRIYANIDTMNRFV